MKNGPAVSPAVTAVIVVVLLGFIGFLAYHNFVPKQADAGMTFGSHADMSKLSPEQLDTVRKEFEAAKSSRGATAN